MESQPSKPGEFRAIASVDQPEVIYQVLASIVRSLRSTSQPLSRGFAAGIPPRRGLPTLFRRLA